MGAELPPIRFVTLSEEHDCAGFDCNNNEINQWVRRKAIKEHQPGVLNVTCAIPEGKLRPIGIFALSTVAEEVGNLPGFKYRIFRSGLHFPAMHLVWLATDKGFADRGLGKLMAGHVIRIFADVGTQIGIPHLILTPAEQDREKLVQFYSDLGFKCYKDGDSMFLSIDDARDAIAKALAIAETL